MVYVVAVGYTDFFFTDSEEAFGFARTAKKSCEDGKVVTITLYSEDEWVAKNEKKED